MWFDYKYLKTQMHFFFSSSNSLLHCTDEPIPLPFLVPSQAVNIMGESWALASNGLGRNHDSTLH